MVRSFEIDSRAFTVGTRAFQQTLVSLLTVDDWEDEDLSEYSLTAANAFGIETANPIADNASLIRDGSAVSGYEEAVSTAGLAAYPSKGDTFQAKVRHEVDSSDAVTGSQGGPIFAAADVNNWYAIRQDAASDRIRIMKHSDANGQEALATTSYDSAEYTANDVVVMEITWDDGTLGGSDNDITGTLYDADKSNEIATVSANDSDHATNTGVGAHGYADGDASWYVDDYEIIS